MPSGAGLDAAVAGMNKGIQKANDAAARIARGAGDSEALTDLTQSEHQVQASARSAEAADKTLGSLLDVKA